MVISNKTDRFNPISTCSHFELVEPYSYDDERAQRLATKQRCEFQLQDSLVSYIGLLTYNDHSVTNEFDYVDEKTGEMYHFTLPYNIQNHPIVQLFFKRLKQTCKRLYAANISYSYVCEQGEGGVTHSFHGARGEGNNPHIHFLIYSDVFINPIELDILIKYYWQGHKRVIRKCTSFDDKYTKQVITDYNNARYGKAGLNLPVNGGVVNSTHSASGYLTSYVTKNNYLRDWKLTQMQAIKEQFYQQVALFGLVLGDYHEDLLKSIYRSFLIKHSPRTLHSNGVGSCALRHLDPNDFTLPTYYNTGKARASMCLYLRRHLFTYQQKHPHKLDKNLRPVYVRRFKDNYLEYKLKTYHKRHTSMVNTFKSYLMNYVLYYDRYCEYLKTKQYDSVKLDLSKLDLDRIAIYNLIYKGRRFEYDYNNPQQVAINPLKDLEKFTSLDIHSSFQSVPFHFILPSLVGKYVDYSFHPYFADIVADAVEINHFVSFFRSVLAEEWRNDMIQRQELRLRQKRSLRARE